MGERYWISGVQIGMIRGSMAGECTESGQLLCDIDEAPMRRVGSDGFECTKCEQRWNFWPDGTAQCTILGRLYPQKMGYRMKQEYAAYKLSQAIFKGTARVILGQITSQECDNTIKDYRRAVDEFLERGKPKWWQFWKL